jgi:uncharacterized membrane protein YcaP (DUF421 family)
MNDIVFFFGGWIPILRILLVGSLMYVALIVMLRVSRNRTLASMNAIDFIFLAAIGSAYGRALTAQEVGLVDAVATFTVLLVIRRVATWLQMRWPFFRSVVENRPALLFFQGEFIHEMMRRQSVSEALVRAAMRKQGIGSLGEVEAIVLESSGDFSILKSIGDRSTLGPEIKAQIDHRTDGDTLNATL